MRFLSGLLVLMMSFSAMAESKSEARVKASDAAKVLRMFMANDREAIPVSLLKHAECVMVITNMVKGGFVIGVRSGWGLTSCRTAEGWSEAAFHQLSGLNFGFLIGLEKLNVVLVFTRPDAVNVLSGAKVSLGTDLSIAAGPVGAGLEAGTDFKLDSPVYSYSRGKGLYAGASLSGSVIDPKEGYNHVVYGKNATTREILTTKNQASVSTVQPFINALMKYAPSN